MTMFFLCSAFKSALEFTTLQYSIRLIVIFDYIIVSILISLWLKFRINQDFNLRIVLIKNVCSHLRCVLPMKTSFFQSLNRDSSYYHQLVHDSIDIHYSLSTPSLDSFLYLYFQWFWFIQTFLLQIFHSLFIFHLLLIFLMRHDH